jgi:hypothetical protein
MEENTISNGTSGSSGTSGKSTLKTQKKQIKSVECKACKSFSYDEVELRNRVKALSATYSVNQVASMLRIHSQYIKEVLNSK